MGMGVVQATATHSSEARRPGCSLGRRVGKESDRYRDWRISGLLRIVLLLMHVSQPLLPSTWFEINQLGVSYKAALRLHRITVVETVRHARRRGPTLLVVANRARTIVQPSKETGRGQRPPIQRRRGRWKQADLESAGCGKAASSGRSRSKVTI